MEVKLDLKDRKILAELDFDARQPISRIAKKVRVSKEVALYRIKKLEEEKIIKQYYAIINTAKIGYYYCRLFIKLQNINKEIEKKIIDYFKDNSKVAYLGIVDGALDLVIGYWAENLYGFEEFVDSFVFKYGHYILEKDISIGLTLYQFKYGFLLNKKQSEEFQTGGLIESLKIDEIDQEILIGLTKNCRISLEELSKKLGLTGKAIQHRIKNLINKKIIVGFRAWIDYKRFGYSNNKVFLYLQNLTKSEFNNLVNYIKGLHNCVYITKPIGKTDLEFEILTKTREEFFSIIQKLREKFGKIIKSYDNFIIHEEPISRFIPI